MAMILNTRQKLDQKYNAKADEKVTVIYSSSPTMTKKAEHVFKGVVQIKSLKQLSANVISKNKKQLFKQLTKLPQGITNEFPELNVNYKQVFIDKVNKLLNGINFKPSEGEKAYLDKITNSLKSENPYNSVHGVLKEIDEKIKTAFLSDYKKNMQPIRNEIVKLMNEYTSAKTEYVTQMGHGL